MSPKENKKYDNMEVIRIGGRVYFREPFGSKAVRAIEELNTVGKNIDLMQTVLMRKNEGKRFYI